MKAKCVKSDPLGWLTVGRIYECTECGQNVIVNGTGFALSRENFNEMFETNMEVFVVTERTEARDWEEIYFEVHGVWPTFEKALEYLEGEKKKCVARNGSETTEIKHDNRRANWSYNDWDGNYYFKIEPVTYCEQ